MNRRHPQLQFYLHCGLLECAPDSEISYSVKFSQQFTASQVRIFLRVPEKFEMLLQLEVQSQDTSQKIVCCTQTRMPSHMNIRHRQIAHNFANLTWHRQMRKITSVIPFLDFGFCFLSFLSDCFNLHIISGITFEVPFQSCQQGVQDVY